MIDGLGNVMLANRSYCGEPQLTKLLSDEASLSKVKTVVTPHLSESSPRILFFQNHQSQQ